VVFLILRNIPYIRSNPLIYFKCNDIPPQSLDITLTSLYSLRILYIPYIYNINFFMKIPESRGIPVNLRTGLTDPAGSLPFDFLKLNPVTGSRKCDFTDLYYFPLIFGHSVIFNQN